MGNRATPRQESCDLTLGGCSLQGDRSEVRCTCVGKGTGQLLFSLGGYSNASAMPKAPLLVSGTLVAVREERGTLGNCALQIEPAMCSVWALPAATPWGAPWWCHTSWFVESRISTGAIGLEWKEQMSHVHVHAQVGDWTCLSSPTLLSGHRTFPLPLEVPLSSQTFPYSAIS